MQGLPSIRALRRTLQCITTIAAIGASAGALADEGMWTFDHAPVDQIQSRYGVALTPAMLEHLQQSAVKFGASGSFVSERGLMLTNHHVALDCIEQLSTPTRDLVRTGFVAKHETDELKCPGATARVLVATEDVSATISAATATAANDGERNAARKAAIARLESECNTQASHRCEVVSLYGGAVHRLYRYQEWSDVRLVFAPEAQAANYGGDPDNFVYPRYALDFALLRVYADGKPVHPAHRLTMARKAVSEGDPIFVIGHPGHTERLWTMAQFDLEREVLKPIKLASARSQQAMMHAYSARSPEAARQAYDTLFGTENWLKSMQGQEAAMNDAALVAARRADEERLRALCRARGCDESPWKTIETATAHNAARARELWAVSYGYRTLFDAAGKLVEITQERRLPEAERLAAYREAALPALEMRLRSDTPYYKDFEIARLAEWLTQAQTLLGPDHPFVRATLAGATPAEAAQRLIRGTKLDDAHVRAALLDGGAAAVAASDDPLLRVAAAVYPLRRALAREQEEQIDTPIERAADQIARTRFELLGTSVAPDATGTLRLSYGKVAGYTAHGIATPYKTTLGGWFARADGFDNRPPFDLPPRVAQARKRIDDRVPLVFATTADIIGGNSGSPVVDRNGEWVGVIFDSNLEGLGASYAYSETVARAIAVDVRAILHALDQIYDAPNLAAELRKR